MIFNLIALVIINSAIAFISDSTEIPSVTTIDQIPKVDQVVFVSALFRHGDRTPNYLYPGDPNNMMDFDPPGFGKLIQKGRDRARQLGAVLRELYNDLLGDTYQPNLVIARSTDSNRTITSLIEVLTGLYPNSSQPMDRNVHPLNHDILLAPRKCIILYNCLMHKVTELEEVKTARHQKELLNETLLRDIPGFPSTSLNQLHDTLIAELNMNLTIPEWAKNESIKQQLENVILTTHKLRSFNTALRRLNGGTLLKNITESMTGIADGTIKDGRKIQLFSGHESTVAAFLSTLGVFKPHVPKYSSCVIVELLRDNEAKYHVRIRYNLGVPQTSTILTIPGCSDPCPLQTFLQLMNDVIPTDNELITDADLVEEKSKTRR